MNEPKNGRAPHDEEGARSEGTLRELERVAEALLFAADAPVEAARVAEVFAQVTGEPAPPAGRVRQALERLNETYAQTGRVFRVHEWAGGFRLATQADVAPVLQAFFEKPQTRRLSRSLLETAAVLAYRQPATKPEVDFVRGVDSDYALRKLMERGLVDVVGRSEAVGRPLLYGTTPRFLEVFGLRSLDDLPTLREIEALLQDPAFSEERARLLFEQESPGETGNAADAPGVLPEGTKQDDAAPDQTERP